MRRADPGASVGDPAGFPAQDVIGRLRRVLTRKRARTTPRLPVRPEELTLHAHPPHASWRRPGLAVLTAVLLCAVGLVPPARAEDPDPVEAPVPVAEDLAIAAPRPVPATDAADQDDPAVGAVVRTEDGLEVVTVEAEPGEAADVVTDLERDPDVLDAFVDMPVTIAATDPRRPDQWNLDEIGVDGIPEAPADGSGEIVAVLDTGVRASHPDLAGRVLCLPGADFTGAAAGACTDPHGHGTHLAGIISAITGNGYGVAGVSAAQILPVRVLDANGRGMTSDIVAGILWAAKNGASVINLSIVSDETNAYDEAIRIALDKDVVVVAAAGNNRTEGNLPQSPASTDGVLAVAATDRLGLSAPFSNSALPDTASLVSAPGVDIWSTTPTGFAEMTGTSMAAPHVSGIVARYRALHSGATAPQVRDAVLGTANDLEVDGWDRNTGYGLIDMQELLTGRDSATDAMRTTVPAAPLLTRVTAGPGSLTLGWRAPDWKGGSAITEYVARAYPLTGEAGPVQVTAPPADRVVTIPGLVSGATYQVVVHANNASPGEGQHSMPSDPVRVPTRPTAARIGTPTAGPGAARVRWSAPTSSGGSPITGYVVRAYRGWDKVAEVRVPDTARDVRIGGLTNGRAHTFLVRAVNAVGPGPWSARSIAVTPLARPGAPAIGTPAAANDAARVYWRAPSDDGGAPISAYVIKVYQGTRGITSVTVSGSARSVLVTGLANKAYYSFTVTAKNAVGLGTPSPRSGTVRTT